MDPRTDSLFAGIAGIPIESAQFDLGEGLILKKIYAHFMAPFMMAFAPAKKGEAHPGPWSAVQGGLGIDIGIELHVPATFYNPKFYDRLNTVWWITALIRLRGATAAHVPVIADRPFAEVPKDWKIASILPMEALPRRLFADPLLKSLSSDDLLWLKETWIKGGELMHHNSALNDAFQAFDAAGSLPTSSVALLSLWGALEHLFSPAKQELRFRVSANIAAYLEPPGASRLELHRRLTKLYDARSGVAHGSKLKSTDALIETYSIGNRILNKILTAHHVPSKDDLERELFAP